MSDNWIILIPEKAGFVPPEEKQKLALAKLRELTPGADEVEIEKTDKVRFEFCGENFTKITCPACSKIIEMDWWQNKMDKDYGDNSDFKLMPYQLPCCGATKTLHDLNYYWQQGFARFSLSSMNPNIGSMPSESVALLETILGCQLRVIYCHI
jgi:hypothetical protein